MDKSSHFLLETRSTPNLARLRAPPSSQASRQNAPRHGHQSSAALASHGRHHDQEDELQRQLRSIHLHPDPSHYEEEEERYFEQYEKEGSDGMDDSGGGGAGTDGSDKMSRSERKKLWRKNLSHEKLSKLRVRDARRKRLERVKMTDEKRRELRNKDTARKAALRAERRKEYSSGPSADGPKSDGREFGEGSSRDSRRSAQADGSHRKPSRSRSSGRASSKTEARKVDDYTKIPVHSLLN